MSSAATWLQKQRKTDLVELADKAGMKDPNKFLKSDLEDKLDDYLRAHQSRLAKEGSFNEYYRRVSASPGAAKKETSKEVAVVEAKTPKRRNPKPKEDDTKPGSSTALTRTPGSGLVTAETVPLPPPPAVIAGHIDRTRQRAQAQIRHFYARSGLVGTVDALRQKVSVGGSVELLGLALEVAGLRAGLLPGKFLTTLPASRALGTGEIPVRVPDLFALLRADFWSVFLLWFLASVLLPMTAAYFFNVTLKVKGARGTRAAGAGVLEYDPLTFNVAKGLIAYVVFGCGFQVFDLPSFASRAMIEDHVPGGYKGIIISTGIGALVSLYEAILRKY